MWWIAFILFGTYIGGIFGLLITITLYICSLAVSRK